MRARARRRTHPGAIARGPAGGPPPARTPEYPAAHAHTSARACACADRVHRNAVDLRDGRGEPLGSQVVVAQQRQHIPQRDQSGRRQHACGEVIRAPRRSVELRQRRKPSPSYLVRAIAQHGARNTARAFAMYLCMPMRALTRAAAHAASARARAPWREQLGWVGPQGRRRRLLGACRRRAPCASAWRA